LNRIADHANFVRQQNDYGRQRGPGGQSVALEKVQGYGYPARQNGYQGTAYIQHCDFDRQGGAVEMPKPEDLTQRSDDDEKLSCDSNLSPTFFDHAEVVTLW